MLIYTVLCDYQVIILSLQCIKVQTEGYSLLLNPMSVGHMTKNNTDMLTYYQSVSGGFCFTLWNRLSVPLKLLCGKLKLRTGSGVELP